MDPKISPSDMLLASPSASAEVLHFPPAEGFPPIDERLVRPETREEIVRGRRVLALPADPPHADRHCELNYVVRAHVVPGYIGSTDMLTRWSKKSDFATDTCVRKQGIDEKTGTRYLEELAFEVVHMQTLKDITERAEDLSARGVRRLFAIFVKKGEVKEWLPSARRWQLLDAGASITDRCLVRPIHVNALLDAAEADDEVARALVKKDNPVIATVREDGREEGRKEGRKEARAEIFEIRLGRALSEAERSRLWERIDRLGKHRVDAVMLTFSGEVLGAWLADPNAI